MVKPGSPEEMAEAISELSQDESRMKAMSHKGVEIVRKYFTWEKNAENTYQSIRETIKKFNTAYP